MSMIRSTEILSMEISGEYILVIFRSILTLPYLIDLLTHRPISIYSESNSAINKENVCTLSFGIDPTITSKIDSGYRNTILVDTK